jgi:dihydroorotate dehydrogenase (fumarate)
MADLSVNYLGLNLRSPLIVGSSGLTSGPAEMKKLEDNGAGAVVVKSLFEEQIRLEADHQAQGMRTDSMMSVGDLEIFDYLDYQVKEKYLTGYLERLHQAKKSLMIPVIASINCVSSSEWVAFARQIEEAGADALELNIALMPAHTDITEQQIVAIHQDIIFKVKEHLSIPVAVKMSPSFANMSWALRQIAQARPRGLVLFNRFYSPDINLDTLQVQPAPKFSSSSDLSQSLRWISLMSGKVGCDLCASTGVHTGEDVLKVLLAGGKAAQCVSALYQHGPQHIQAMNAAMERWMEKKGYNYVDQFAGKLHEFEGNNPGVFERIQFMKYYAQIGDKTQPEA